MNPTFSRRGRAIAFALFAGASLATTVSTFAQFVPFANDVDIATTVVPVPLTVTLSTAALSTFASYNVKLQNIDPFNGGEILQPVIFVATTSVLDGSNVPAPGQSAVFNYPGAVLPVGCSANTAGTTLTCNFADGLPTLNSIKTFTLTVKAPLEGAKIVLTSQTSWFEPEEGGAIQEATAPFPTVTALTVPNPTTVATFLPLPTGGTVSTGTTGCTAANGCIASAIEPFVTFVRVPQSTTVNVDQILPVLAADNAFSNLNIPGLFGTPTSPAADLLVITFRRHKSVIGSGTGSLLDAALILHERIFYKGATTLGVEDTAFHQVYPCLITGGPLAATSSAPGRPCIASRKVYNIFNSPNPKAQWLGTHEWIIHANDNGGYRVQPGA